MKLSHPCWKFDNKQRVLKCKAYCDDCLDKVTLSSRLESARLHLACVANGKSRFLQGPINYRFANAREGRLARENVTLERQVSMCHPTFTRVRMHSSRSLAIIRGRLHEAGWPA